MSDLKIKPIDMNGAFLLQNYYAEDSRGYFTKIYEKNKYNDEGIEFVLNETFATCSMKNVIRGLHFQIYTPQAKIVSVLSGEAWDVIVDMRASSPTFKQWRAFEISARNHTSIYVPRGFAHGFACLQDNTIMLYQCEGKYNSQYDTGIAFGDKDLNIPWPVDEMVAIHSKRDLELPSLKEFLNIHPEGVIGD